MGRLWLTDACSRARVALTASRRQVYASEAGQEGDAGAHHRCGLEMLPIKSEKAQQLPGPHCDAVCDRAATTYIAIEKNCRAAPEDERYDDPSCYKLEQRFFGMRPDIFECWCTRVTFRDYMQP